MIISVKVHPGSRQEKVERLGNDRYEVWLKEIATEGRANRRLINLFAKEFGVSVRKIKIKNPTSRNKIIEIDNN